MTQREEIRAACVSALLATSTEEIVTVQRFIATSVGLFMEEIDGDGNPVPSYAALRELLVRSAPYTEEVAEENPDAFIAGAEAAFDMLLLLTEEIVSAQNVNQMVEDVLRGMGNVDPATLN